MSTFIMFGRYSGKSMKKISAERTVEAAELVKKFGGEFKGGYALLGKYDLITMVDFPNMEQAMKASVALNRLLGISFETAPAVTLDEFDQMMGEI